MVKHPSRATLVQNKMAITLVCWVTSDVLPSEGDLVQCSSLISNVIVWTGPLNAMIGILAKVDVPPRTRSGEMSLAIMEVRSQRIFRFVITDPNRVVERPFRALGVIAQNKDFTFVSTRTPASVPTVAPNDVPETATESLVTPTLSSVLPRVLVTMVKKGVVAKPIRDSSVPVQMKGIMSVARRMPVSFPTARVSAQKRIQHFPQTPSNAEVAM
mmetsp:Transcript_450/g.1094  ORF Transcript_450/g.1094 Transcript_450/m.1094 type:complete len:214 (+) Transcript_450:156-797(+)